MDIKHIDITVWQNMHHTAYIEAFPQIKVNLQENTYVILRYKCQFFCIHIREKLISEGDGSK